MSVKKWYTGYGWVNRQEKFMGITPNFKSIVCLIWSSSTYTTLHAYMGTRAINPSAASDYFIVIQSINLLDVAHEGMLCP